MIFKFRETQKASVFISTVFREVDNDFISGYVMKVLWPERKVIKKVPIEKEAASRVWDSKGGNRGGRGVYVFKNLVYVATESQVFVYDTELNKQNVITNEWLAGLHDIYVNEKGIWGTSTLHDMLVLIDFEGNTLNKISLAENTILCEQVGITPRKNIDKDFGLKNGTYNSLDDYVNEDRLHINGIHVEGEIVYTLANKVSSLLKVNATTKEVEVMIKDPGLKAPHNCVFLGDFIYINNTMHQAIHKYSLDGKLNERIPTRIFEHKNLSTQFSKPGWQRGLWPLTNNILIVGTSPASIFEVDIKKKKTKKKLIIDEDVRHCVHGLFVMPN